MTDAEMAAYDAGMQEAYGADREARFRIWAFERVASNEMMCGWTVTSQMAEADRIVAWLKGEGDGGQKTPDRVAA